MRFQKKKIEKINLFSHYQLCSFPSPLSSSPSFSLQFQEKWDPLPKSSRKRLPELSDQFLSMISNLRKTRTSRQWVTAFVNAAWRVMGSVHFGVLSVSYSVQYGVMWSSCYFVQYDDFFFLRSFSSSSVLPSSSFFSSSFSFSYSSPSNTHVLWSIQYHRNACFTLGSNLPHFITHFVNYKSLEKDEMVCSKRPSWTNL